ncbi:MAG: hypothetical protein J6A37_16620 [Oscillospiraceae bacterium]|nr:hypothetical protein [Oscillospiraceae bacterium]
MTAEEKRRLSEFERDIKKMQKEHKETFAEFEQKKAPEQKNSSLFIRLRDRIKSLFTR